MSSGGLEMKKKILLTIVILGFLTGCGKVPKLANGEEAIVSFKNSKLAISANDLYTELKDRYALNILIDLMDKKILLKEYPDDAEDAKKYASDELEGIKGYYVDDAGKYDEAALISALQSYYGISTLSEFEEMLKLSYYRNKAVEDYAKKQVSDKEIEDYYKKEVVGDIECSHILISVDAKEDATDAEKKKAEDAALKKAKEVIKELNNGGKFAELAKKYSTDKSNADKGGELGYFNKGEMDAEFEKAAFALKLNAYSKEPVKSAFGYHIILKTGEKDKKALDKIKSELLDTLSEEKLSKDTTLAINALVDLRKEYGFKIQDSDVNSKYSTYVSNQLINAQNNQN